MPIDLPQLIVADVGEWRDWLVENADGSEGIWLVLAKKGHVEPTRITYAEALEEALCSGWIDGLVRRRDEQTYQQRFTPRRPRSQWSSGNVELVERLTEEGRMRRGGLSAIESAKAGGRWPASI
ncbi:MAG TPA: hypothetical protein VGS21_10715 [Acidimicrobiales bacterium]|nr:hypothetical protein [Acidimicrobiales bacterium]